MQQVESLHDLLELTEQSANLGVEKIAFAFLDGDLYESICDSLKLVEGKLSDGAVVIVHDYQNEALPGVAKAVDEWLAQNPGHNTEVYQSMMIIRQHD